MANVLTVGKLSPANLAAYNLVMYFDNVTQRVVRNVSSDVRGWDVSKVGDCSKWTNDQWDSFSFVYPICGDLQPNADIAGVGVMIAFVATAVITVIGCIFRGICMTTLTQDKNPLKLLLIKKNEEPRFSWWTKHRAEFWNDVCGKLIIGLADQQMVTGFAILVSGLHTYHRISAYHFYIVVHVAAFATVTQSMAILVIFDVIHKSLILHSIRVLVYSTTLFMFYYCAWFSYDLTGSEGFRAACPATCQFKHASSNWVVVVIAGSPIYLFIIADLVRQILERRGILKTELGVQEKHASDFTGMQRVRATISQHGFQVARYLIWCLCIVDLCVACFSVFSSWFIWRYDGLVLTPDFDDISWGFGQLVAVILICLPVLTMAEEWKDKSHEDQLQSMGRNRYGRHLDSHGIDARFIKSPEKNDFDNSYFPDSTIPKAAQRYGSTYKTVGETVTDLGSGIQSPGLFPNNGHNNQNSPRTQGYGPLEQNPYSPPPISVTFQPNIVQTRPQYLSQPNFVSQPTAEETVTNRYEIPDIIFPGGDSVSPYGFPSATSFPLQSPTPYVEDPYDPLLHSNRPLVSLSSQSSREFREQQQTSQIYHQVSAQSLRQEDATAEEPIRRLEQRRISYGPGSGPTDLKRKPVGGGGSG